MAASFLVLLLGCGSAPEPMAIAADRDGDGIPEGRDCNDLDATIFPGAREIWYDGIDQDCDGQNDRDADGDGYAWEPNGTLDCDDTRADVNPSQEEHWYDGLDQDCDGLSDYDADKDGYNAKPWGVDCNDASEQQHPGANEIWYDGLDQDCDGANDFDRDQDGYNGGSGGADCDDNDPAVNPDQEEIWYDGVDQDCDGNDADQDGDGQDSDQVGGTDCDDLNPTAKAVEQYADQDGDGYGDPASMTQSCPFDPDLVMNAGDCDDSDATVHPLAPETWYDGIDSDCDGGDDFDQDGDGAQSVDYGGNDCDDQDASFIAYTAWLDADGDHFGDASGPIGVCTMDGLAVNNSDCDDGDATVNPLAAEIWYDGIDQDCDGNDSDQDGDGDPAAEAGGTDCDDTDPTVSGLLSWIDADGDGYGDPATGFEGCDADAGVSNADDCDDSDPNIHPGASEVAFDGVDQDCDGSAGDEIDPLAHFIVGGSEARSKTGTGLVASDFDHDGVLDLILGAPDAIGAGSWTGEVYVAYGPLSTATLPVADTMVLQGVDPGERAGRALLAADFDGDGVDELAVGSPGEPGASWTPAGQVALWTAAYSGTYSLGAAAAVLLPEDVTDAPGWALAASDMDQDGQAELFVSAPGAGKVYGLADPLAKGKLARAEVVLSGDVSTEVGSAMVSGDLDGDGWDDLVVGSAGGTGQVAILLGPVSSGSLGDADAVWTGVDLGEEAGAALALLGDQDGDGLLDLGIGAPVGEGDEAGAGRVYILLDPAGTSGSLAAADGRILGTTAGDALGASLVVMAGDGQSWLALGAPERNGGGGSLYLLDEFGIGTWTVAPDFPELQGTGSSDAVGSTLLAVEDQDGDGLEDLWLSAPGAKIDGTSSGGAYLILTGSLP